MSVLAVAAGVVIVWRLVLLAWLPMKPCTALLCDRGRNKGSNARRWGHDCKKCKGRGEVPKVGARQVRKAIGKPL